MSDEDKTKPYRLFFHPMKSLIDDIVSYITYNIILRLQRYRFLPLTLESKTTRRHLNFFRKIVEKISPYAITRELKLWNQTHKKNRNESTINPSTSEIKDLTCDIPRLNDILSKWNVSSFNEGSSHSKDEFDELINLSIISSTKYIQPEIQETKTKTKQKIKLSVATLKKQLENLPSSVHIILGFWGGGMSTKVNLGKGIQVSRLLCEANNNMESIIHITPNYRLAPEHPFPSSVIDSLSVLDFLFQSVPKHVSIHISGISAGGNLAAVCVLEAHRKFPGRVKSTYLWDPMLEPRCDTRSYYLNSNSGLAIWATWSWRAYLSLDNDFYIHKATKKNGKSTSYDDFSMNYSNREVYKRSTILNNNPEIRRLCEPIVGLESSLEFENAPIFIISTASGDPLRDDGLKFGAELEKKGANVTMIQSWSSHTFGMEFDRTFKDKIIEAWGSAIFGS